MKYRIVKHFGFWVAQKYNPVLEMWFVMSYHYFKFGAKLAIGEHAIRNAKTFKSDKVGLSGEL